MSIATSIGGQFVDIQIVGKVKLPVEKLPLGNFYCLFCEELGFVVPENGVADTPDFCGTCDYFFAIGLF